MFQDNLVAKISQNHMTEFRQGMQVILTKTANCSVTLLVAIPSVSFFSDYVVLKINVAKAKHIVGL